MDLTGEVTLNQRWTAVRVQHRGGRSLPQERKALSLKHLENMGKIQSRADNKSFRVLVFILPPQSPTKAWGGKL
jgi:hypothetical protein